MILGGRRSEISQRALIARIFSEIVNWLFSQPVFPNQRT